MDMFELFASAPLYALAALFCVARGLWLAFHFARRLQSNPAEWKRRAYLFGAAINFLVYTAGGVAVLAGISAFRWLLVAQLVRVAFRDIRSNALASAEGRKAGELAASWEYVIGRAPPKLWDYLAASIVAAPLSLLPAVILLVGDS